MQRYAGVKCRCHLRVGGRGWAMPEPFIRLAAQENKPSPWWAFRAFGSLNLVQGLQGGQWAANHSFRRVYHLLQLTENQVIMEWVSIDSMMAM